PDFTTLHRFLQRLRPDYRSSGWRGRAPVATGSHPTQIQRNEYRRGSNEKLPTTRRPSRGGVGDKQNSEDVKDEHHGEVGLGLFVCARKFFPREDAPERCNHRSGLADRVRDSNSGLGGRDEVEYESSGQDGAAGESQNVAMKGSVEETAKGDGLADERMLHEVEIPDEAGEQR